MRKPEIGDTIIIRGVVTGLLGDGVFSYNNQTGCHRTENFTGISEIVPKPWTPKVGDKCYYRFDVSSPLIVYTIRGMFEEKAWLSWTLSNGSETSAITEFNTEIYRLCAD